MFHRLAGSLPLLLVFAAGCGDPPAEPLGIDAPSHAALSDAAPRFSAWSEPVNLGWPINTPGVTDGNPAISPDGLSLYYDSDRTDLPGARGARDMWVSRRACTDHQDPACAWQTPVNLGPLINSPYVEGGPKISSDGHLLLYLSHGTRENCPFTDPEPDPTRPCDADLYMSWRPDPTDDLGWRTPVRLPPGINTEFQDNEAVYLPNADPGHANFYFSRAVAGARTFDIYSALIRITRRGNPSGIEVRVIRPPAPVEELNWPGALDGGLTIREDAREIFFGSSVQRPGIGRLDLWTSTRRSPAHPWSAPVNPGTPLNSRFVDLTPSLSHDGRTLFFTSDRQDPRRSIGWDIYMSTRTPLP